MLANRDRLVKFNIRKTFLSMKCKYMCIWIFASGHDHKIARFKMPVNQMRYRLRECVLYVLLH